MAAGRRPTAASRRRGCSAKGFPGPPPACLISDGLYRVQAFDCLYRGWLVAPGVSDLASAGLLLAIRQRVDQYVNLRPMPLLNGLASPLASRTAADIDMICVRENSE